MSVTPKIDWPVLLTVRGKMLPKSLEEMRVLHNRTAGSAAGIAAARSLGDLSHLVYTPFASPLSNAETGELLFLDVWQRPKGIMDFFANEKIIQSGTKLFGARDATIWMRAEGAFSYALPAVRGKNDRIVGMLRVPIASPEKAIEIFRAVDIDAQRDARRRGLLSHEIFIKLSVPGDTTPLELLGIDVWSDRAGMTEHYGDATHMKVLGSAFAGAPDPSAWEPAAGEWSEW